MIVKTLQQVHDRVASLADVAGQTTGTNPRHPEADNFLMINDSYATYREHLVTKGFREFISPTAALDGPAAPETLETYGVVDFPTTAMALTGFDVLDGSEWRPLEEIDWEERRSWQQTLTGGAARPLYYSLRSFGEVSAAAESVGKVAFFPFKATVKYRLHILPEWVAITNGTHKMIFPSSSGFDFVVAHAVIKIAGMRDGDKAKRVVIAQAMLDAAIAQIGQFVPRLTSSGAKTIRRSPSYRSGRYG